MDVPKLSLEKVETNAMCFGCGKANQHGLKMKFYQEDAEAVKSEFIPDENHQGWPGYVHGGILMTAMDEGIGWAAHFKNIYTVTAKIEVRLKSMARIGEPLIVNARITKQTKRTLEVEAKIKRKDDSIVAEASSIQFIMQPQKIGFSKSS
jgi:acyl-coenzyme A thioesterase PaaI-like protein